MEVAEEEGNYFQVHINVSLLSARRFISRKTKASTQCCIFSTSNLMAILHTCNPQMVIMRGSFIRWPLCLEGIILLTKSFFPHDVLRTCRQGKEREYDW